jgi:hypothetical protein
MGYRHTTQLIDRTGRVDPATMETFTEADFAVGREVSMNGAQFLIYGCDEFTRDYYTKVHPSHTPLPTASRALALMLTLIPTPHPSPPDALQPSPPLLPPGVWRNVRGHPGCV